MNRLTFHHLTFTGPQVAPAHLALGGGTNLIWGASNTGKSFVLKAIDFMLGGREPLPPISEREGYDTIWMGCSLSGNDDFTLSRATSGGGFKLHRGLVAAAAPGVSRVLSQVHNRDNDANLSMFLLGRLGFRQSFLATSGLGKKESLSFRHLVRFVLVDETSIQVDRSPVESGQHSARVLEHRVFRFLLTGSDDSALVEVTDDKTFKTSKETRIAVVNEMIALVEEELSTHFPDASTLPDEAQRLTTVIEKLQSDLDAAQAPIDVLLEQKNKLAQDLPTLQSRIAEIELHAERFRQLDDIYVSDIQRLESIEEAGFLIGLRANLPCPLCGAAIDEQHRHDAKEIELQRKAAVAEISKIRQHREELKSTVSDLTRERETLTEQLPKLQQGLRDVEAAIAQLTPKAKDQARLLREVIAMRDRVSRGLGLLEQIGTYQKMRSDFEALKNTPKKDRPKLTSPTTAIHEFCKVVSEVLKRWGFPGEHSVSWDETTFDLVIDGKRRADNGKGVRAVTHAAFKVALLIYCRQQGLPHPGFLVLDTPLLTYRDPLVKGGELEDDERRLASSQVKARFFEHLVSLRESAQFIILENVDPPSVAGLQTEVFEGSEGMLRLGFFPLRKAG